MASVGTVATKLVLKNGIKLTSSSERKKKSKKKTKSSKKRKDRNAKRATNDLNIQVAKETKETKLTRFSGKGKIIVSGVTVKGEGTKFSNEVKAGDALGVLHPATEVEEIKIVRFVLNDSHLSVSSAFSSSITDSIPYFCIRQDSKYQSEQEKATLRKQKRRKVIETATGTRVHEYKSNLTREQLLDMRINRTGDRRC